MIKKFYKSYIGSFRGLRREVWWLAVMTFINRAGTMVVPFMSLYLKEDLGFTLPQIGWAMTVFGIGSVIGSWLGGKLTDKIGFYPVIMWSLTVSGIMFILLQFARSFEGFCIGIFFLMVVADMLRPAVYVAVNAYSKPANRTRSVTLIRLAINLGFSMGPAAGGFIIALWSYAGLFWTDGLTCILAGAFFVTLLNKKKVREDTKVQTGAGYLSPYRDKPYLLFVLIVALVGFAFLQYFSTIPLFYRDVHHLSEGYIGLILSTNGLLIFLLEMPMVKYTENRNIPILITICISSLVIAMSFIVLNLTLWTGILIVGMLLVTVGEMGNFPFLNRFALDRAERGKSGDYMALFTIAFSIGHIFGHNTGMHLINKFGFSTTWYIMSGALVVAALLTLVLKVIVRKEQLKQ